MQSNTASSWQKKLYKIFTHFITPANLPQQSEERRRVRALLSFLLAICILGFFLTIIRYVANKSITLDLTWTITTFIFYFIARRGYYLPIVYFMIVAAAFFPLLFYLFSPIGLVQLEILSAVISMLLATTFTNRRTTLQVIALNLVIVLFLLIQTPKLNWTDLVDWLTIFAFISILIILTSRISERDVKQLQQQAFDLREVQIQFRYLFDTFPQPIIIHINGKIMYSNASAERLFQKRDLTGSMIADFIPSDEIRNSQLDNQTGSMIVNYDTRLRLANRQTIPLRVTTQVISYEKHLATLMLLLRSDLDSDNKLVESVVNTFSQPLIALSTDFETMPNILFANPAFCEMLGYPESELRNRSRHILQDLLGADNTLADVLKSTLDSGENSFLLELLQTRKDGTSILTEWHGHIIYDSSGYAKYCISSVTNLNKSSNKQSELHRVQQAVVSELGLLSLSIDNHLQLLEHAVIMCEQVLEIDNCVIFEYQPNNKALECVAISNAAYDFEPHQILSLDPSSSQVAYALFMHDSIVTESFQNEARFRNFPKSATSDVLSALSVIIPGRKQPYGILSILSHTTKADIEEYLYFLQAIANILGSFAEGSQAQQAERKQREFAEALRDATAMINMRLELSEMLDKLMGYVRQVVPQVESGSVMLWDVAEQGYRFIYTWGLEPDAEQIIMARSFAADEFPLMQKMMRSHRPMILANVDDEPLWVRTNAVERIRSYLGAPIIVQDECIGFFHLNSTILGAFSEHDAMRLQTFADKTGTAILGARYAHELEELVKERTEELQKERERITSILETSGEGILYVENYEIKFANQIAADITGYSIEELIGMDPRKFRADDLTQEEIDMLDKLPSEMEVGIPWRAELRQRRKDGTVFHVGITNSRLAAASKDDYYSVIIMRDISQEKALDIAKSRFIANAAHELRSPITSLKTRMYMINKQPENVDYHISRLDEIVGRMNRLVSDLLDMSYFDYGQVTLRPETIILQDVVERIIAILEPEAELEELNLLRDMPETPIHIWADVHRIEQILTNLITNAIHYTPQGGQICVICSEDTDKQLAIIRVEDTGDGIPPEHIDNIFEAFYRLDNNMEKKGTGLGLSITREIVELHKGQIRVESEAGKGSTFIVTLPLLNE